MYRLRINFIKTLLEQKIDIFCDFTNEMEKLLDKGINRGKMAKVNFDEVKLYNLMEEIKQSVRESVINRTKEF